MRQWALSVPIPKIRHKRKETVQVNKDEVQYFEAPTEHEGETVNVADPRLLIVAPSFLEAISGAYPMAAATSS